MKQNEESSKEEMQKSIATLISLNRLEEREFVLNHTLFPLFLTLFWLHRHRLWTRMNQASQKWKIQSLMRQIIDNTQKDKNLDGLFKGATKL